MARCRCCWRRADENVGPCAYPQLDAQGLRLAYASQGEKPAIFGEPRVEFDLCQTADEHVAKIMAWAATGEWDLLRNW